MRIDPCFLPHIFWIPKLAPVYCRLRSGRKVDLTAKSGVQVQPDQFNNSNGTIRQVAEATDKDRLNKELRNLRNYLFDQLSIITDDDLITYDWLNIR